MKRFSGIAALAILAAATVAHAQGGPVNHQKGASGATWPVGAAPPPPPPSPPTPPAPGIEAAIDQAQAITRADLAQHRISRLKAELVRYRLHAIRRRLRTLDERVARISRTLPAPDWDAAPPR